MKKPSGERGMYASSGAAPEFSATTPTASSCTVVGCVGGWGPGCVSTPLHPNYFKCGHNKRLLNRVYRYMTDTSARITPVSYEHLNFKSVQQIEREEEQRDRDRMEHDA